MVIEYEQVEVEDFFNSDLNNHLMVVMVKKQVYL